MYSAGYTSNTPRNKPLHWNYIKKHNSKLYSMLRPMNYKAMHHADMPALIGTLILKQFVYL